MKDTGGSVEKLVVNTGGALQVGLSTTYFFLRISWCFWCIFVCFFVHVFAYENFFAVLLQRDKGRGVIVLHSDCHAPASILN